MDNQRDEQIFRARLCTIYDISPEELDLLSPSEQASMMRYVFDPTSESTAIDVMAALHRVELAVPPLLFKHWHGESLSALAGRKGTKRRLRSEAAEERQRAAVYRIIDLMSYGDTTQEAIKTVSGETEYTDGTLEQMYKKNRRWRDTTWKRVQEDPLGRVRITPERGNRKK